MPAEKLALTIEGLPEENGFVRASDFIAEIQSFTSALKNADRLVNRAKSPSFYLRVVGLSLNSPATIVFEAQPKKQDIDGQDVASKRLLGVVDSIDSQQDIGLDAYALLENIQQLVSPIGKSVASISVSAQGRVIDLTETFRAKVSLMMAAEETFPGQLTGMLEYINVHGGTRAFRIYPDIGSGHVTCYFSESLTEAAVDAILRYVEVGGSLRQKKAARYPYAIDVEHIEVFPQEKELPKLIDLLGIAPDATGELTSEEFVWSVRGELE